MPVSEGFKAIGPAWASAATADRTDPDDVSLTPPITIADGWPDTFSDPGGDTPRRAVFNELYYRRDSALLDVRNYGILPWDTEVDTLEDGIKQVNGVLYRALEDNGPTYSNAISPTTSGQTVWETVSGTLSVPSVPDMPTAVASNGQLVWTWNCPLDGGSEITRFDFQWRVSGGTFSAAIQLTNPRYVMTGLTNGTTIEAQIQAVNAQGDSGYSGLGMGTPAAEVPGGGNSFGLRALTGDASGEIDLEWFAPSTGGATITGYTYQWKSGSQSYSSGRQGTATGLSATVGSLTNGTEYDFRVRATNSAGDGAWSNEDSAEPVLPPPPPPADTVPDPPASAPDGTARRALNIDWTWDLVSDDGGAMVTSYDFQWRVAGAAWSGNVTTTTEAYVRTTAPNTSNGIQGRVRATNSVGTSSTWSPTGTVAAGDLIPLPTQRHRFTSGQTWNWPYGASGRASVALFGILFATRNSAHDITLGDRSWNGGVSDGTTLWFIDQTNPDTAFAYNASTRARDATRDISLGSGDWVGGVSDGTTLWFINSISPDRAVAYTASTRARDATRDISLGNSSWNGGVSDGTTLWFVTQTNPDTAFAYNASTRARDATRDISLGNSSWVGGVSDGTTIWLIDTANPGTAFAYNASTSARDATRDISLGIGSWRGGLSDGTTLWFVTQTNPDTAFAYNAPGSSQLVTGGTTYTTVGDADGFVSETLSGIANNQSFAFTLEGAGFAEVYPQV